MNLITSQVDPYAKTINSKVIFEELSNLLVVSRIRVRRSEMLLHLHLHLVKRQVYILKSAADDQTAKLFQREGASMGWIEESFEVIVGINLFRSKECIGD